MPTTIGLGAPNPLSIALKLYIGVTKIKRILDRIFGSLAIFIATAKALGLDGTPGYNDIMDSIANPLGIIQNLISKQEEDASYQEDLALQDYLQTAKENWPYGKSNNIDYKTVEEWGRDGIWTDKGTVTISIWPIQDPKDRQKLASYLGDFYTAKSINGGTAYDSRIQKFEAIIKYNDYLGWASKEFKSYYEKLAESNENNNTTYSSSSGTATSTTTDPGNTGGSVDTTWKSNTYGLSGLSKKATK